ncbi:MAG: hypothetical protein P8K81_02665 [Flavobacteriales bacterium]|nr:hypothetical protein [Flavobacteriales bacterium]
MVLSTHRIFWTAPVVALLVGFMACQEQKGLPYDALDPETSPPAPSKSTMFTVAPYVLLGAEVSGDSLYVNVQYGGGCGAHQFELQVAGPPMKSLPPKQMMQLEHKTSGDPCRALIQKVVTFDLKPYRLSPHGVTIILLDSLKIPYSYD